jgi:hypothetical protein
VTNVIFNNVISTDQVTLRRSVRDGNVGHCRIMFIVHSKGHPRTGHEGPEVE